ncbi:MAG: hypothetical protein ACYTAF_10955 [Planctomycetota bacterium]
MPWVILCDEKISYLRPETHTSIREEDPEREDLLSFGDWQRNRCLRFWLARVGEASGRRVLISDYIGSVPIRGGVVDSKRVRRAADRLAALAAREKVPHLLRQLRTHLDRAS